MTQRKTTTRKPIIEGELHPAEIALLKARTKREGQEERRAKLIADEIAHEQERKRASADEHRVFPFYASVQHGSVRACMEQLGEWSRLPDAKDKPFTIEITSPGGSVFDGLALFDYVKNLQAQGYVVDTYGTGLIASMATVLMQMGSTRILGSNSWFMIHELSDFIIGNLSEIEDAAKVARRINEHLIGLLAGRASLTPAEIRAKSKKTDWYLDAEQTQKYGFVDEIR